MNSVQFSHVFLGTNHWHAIGGLAFPILMFQCNLSFCRCAAYVLGLISSFYFSLASTHKKNSRAGDTKPLYSLKNAPPCFWGLLVKVTQNAFVLARPLSSHIYMGLIWSDLRLAGVYALILYCSRHAATMNPACLPHRFA